MSKNISHPVRICTILPNPDGIDFGRETVQIANPQSVSLEGWSLRDMGGHTFELSGSVGVGGETTFTFKNNEFPLNNKGDIIFLFDKSGAVAHRIEYKKADVKEGEPLTFPDPTEPGKPLVAAYISSILPDPVGADAENEYITIKGLMGSSVNLAGWKFSDKAGHTSDLFGNVEPGEKKTFVLKPDCVSLNNKGDELVLVDSNGAVVHTVKYSKNQVHSGVYIDFNPTEPSPTQGKARLPTVMISSMTPAPAGKRSKTVELKVRGRDADLEGWKLRDSAGNEAPLTGKVGKGGKKTLAIPTDSVLLKEVSGDEVVSLVDASGTVVHSVEFGKQDVARGAAIDFEVTEENLRGATARVPTVVIASILPKPDGMDNGRETITIAAHGGLADVSGWTVTDGSGKTSTAPLEGMIGADKERTYLSGELSLPKDGGELVLRDGKGAEVHRVSYAAKDVQSGVMVDFGMDASDPAAGAARLPTVQICSMLPNPDGVDAGREVVVLKARGATAKLDGWALLDSAGHRFELSGEASDGEDRSVLLADKKFALNNKGDSITLVDADGDVLSVATYDADEVVSGVLVDFGTTPENALVGKARVPTVMIGRVLPDPGDNEALRETITIKARGAAADLAGWKVRDLGGNEVELSGLVESEKTFRVEGLKMGVGKDGDMISLFDKYKREVHRVRYTGADVVAGKELEF